MAPASSLTAVLQAKFSQPEQAEQGRQAEPPMAVGGSRTHAAQPHVFTSDRAAAQAHRVARAAPSEHHSCCRVCFSRAILSSARLFFVSAIVCSR